MKKAELFLLLLLTIFNLCGADFTIAKNGKASCVIVFDRKDSQVQQISVSELKKWVKEISGAELTAIPDGEKHSLPAIRLSSDPEILKQFPEDQKKLQNNDGYAVRMKDGDLYIIGSIPKGVMNGVFRSLQKNSDIIFARTSPGGTFFTKNPDLKFRKTDYIEIPVFTSRGWLLGGYNNTTLWEGIDWIIRNGGNWINHSAGSVATCLKYGADFYCGGGHNLNSVYITEQKYYEKHPEFFPLIKGRRVRPSEKTMRTQLCFANREMWEAFKKELDEVMRIYAPSGGKVFNINNEDNLDRCECNLCRQPIKLADGRVIPYEDERHYSTLFYTFINEMARYVKSKIPGGGINTCAYFFAEPPPYIPLENNVRISFASVWRNAKYPFEHPANAKYNKYLQEWLKRTSAVTLRDYYGLQMEFPRPIDKVAVADFRYILRYNAKKSYNEVPVDAPPLVNSAGVADRNGILIWDYSMPFFYVINEALWNPDIDVIATRNEFIRKVYGNAAEEIIEFHRLVGEQWDNIPGISQWNDDCNGLWMRYVVNRNIGDKLVAQINKALKKDLDPRIRQSLTRISKHLAEVTAVRKISHNAVRAKEKVQFDPELETGAWLGVPQTSDFYYLRTKKSSVENTMVRIIYDDKNLYVGMSANDDNAVFRAAPQGTGRDKWVSDSDKFEFFISGKDDRIRHIIVDCGGNIYDACNSDVKWNGKFTLQNHIRKGKWTMMMTIPFSDLGFSGKPDLALDIMMIRYTGNRGRNKTRKAMVWKGGFPGNRDTFGKLFFL